MKKITLLLAFASLACSVMAQDGDFKKFRFGVNASPIFSWMGSNNPDVKAGGFTMGVNLALSGELYFAENYAFTMGLGYKLNTGGKITYEKKAGNYLPQSDLSEELQTDLLSSSRLAAGAYFIGSGDSSRIMAKGVAISRRVNWLSIPIGFKMRTNELGDSFIRGFAHLPLFGIDIATRARADVKTSTGEYKKEIIYRDIFPINLTVGGGAGIEYYPNDKDLSFIAGIYYNAGLIDFTKNDKDVNGKGVKGVVSDITLRLGVNF